MVCRPARAEPHGLTAGELDLDDADSGHLNSL
jgi:hypothetical protein